MYYLFKKLLRIFTGLLIALPFVLSAGFLSLFFGKQRSVRIIGPYVSKLAKLLVKISIPAIDKPEDFDIFKTKLKRRFNFWKPLYDVSYVKEDRNTLKLNISNCPFCEMFKILGFSEFGEYACDGDIAAALDNADKWDFARKTQIGTGGKYCDNTYCRKGTQCNK